MSPGFRCKRQRRRVRECWDGARLWRREQDVRGNSGDAERIRRGDAVMQVLVLVGVMGGATCIR
jgi:hypothetical protein